MYGRKGQLGSHGGRNQAETPPAKPREQQRGFTGGGRSSGQGVKLLYIRDYLYAEATKEHPKKAKEIQTFLASKNIVGLSR